MADLLVQRLGEAANAATLTACASRPVPTSPAMRATRVLIAGAAGRDFHNFNVVYRDRDDVEVVAFTATQIPNIDGRVYPPELAGGSTRRASRSIPSASWRRSIREHRRRRGRLRVLGRHARARHAPRLARARGGRRLPAARAARDDARARAAGRRRLRRAHRRRQEPDDALRRRAPARRRAAASRSLRHPMPYGDLAAQAVQRFAALRRPRRRRLHDRGARGVRAAHRRGQLVFAGIDYGAILREAEEEADVILWDGGNNDTPFFRPEPAHRRRRPAPARATSCATTPARRTCAWRTSASSTRSTRPTPAASRRCVAAIRAAQPAGADRARCRLADRRSRTADADRAASACSSSRTARR